MVESYLGEIRISDTFRTAGMVEEYSAKAPDNQMRASVVSSIGESAA